MPAERKRLFFALWPDEVTRRNIVERTVSVVDGSGGKPVRAVNLHLTLAFLHAVDTALLPCIATAAASIAPRSALNLPLLQLGHWRRSGILWLAPDLQGGAEAGRLASDLWQALDVCGFTPERRPFQPHVTLARKVTTPVETVQIEPVNWRVSDIVLVESTATGSHPRYSVLQRFEFGVIPP